MNLKAKLGITFLVVSLVFQYLVILLISTHTTFIGGNWIAKEMIWALMFMIIGIVFVCSSLKDNLKKGYFIVTLILILAIGFTFGEYLSQVGIPFLNSDLIKLKGLFK